MANSWGGLTFTYLSSRNGNGPDLGDPIRVDLDNKRLLARPALGAQVPEGSVGDALSDVDDFATATHPVTPTTKASFSMARPRSRSVPCDWRVAGQFATRA
jgi:hypothetical protein